MNWCQKELEIKGDTDFLKELESIIDKHNPPADYLRRTGHIADILQELHLNINPYKEVWTYWTKAGFDKKGNLRITEMSAGDDKSIYADILMKAFPDKVSSINRTSVLFC